MLVSERQASSRGRGGIQNAEAELLHVFGRVGEPLVSISFYLVSNDDFCLGENIMILATNPVPTPYRSPVHLVDLQRIQCTGRRPNYHSIQKGHLRFNENARRHSVLKLSCALIPTFERGLLARHQVC